MSDLGKETSTEHGMICFMVTQLKAEPKQEFKCLQMNVNSEVASTTSAFRGLQLSPDHSVLRRMCLRWRRCEGLGGAG